MKLLIAASNANRISDAVLAVRGQGDALDCLRRIAANPIDLADRSPSRGKDALWELELLAILRSHGAAARPLDPPDLIADFGQGDYAIACKKIYSETCAIDTDGVVWCSGSNNTGALGIPLS